MISMEHYAADYLTIVLYRRAVLQEYGRRLACIAGPAAESERAPLSDTVQNRQALSGCDKSTPHFSQALHLNSHRVGATFTRAGATPAECKEYRNSPKHSLDCSLINNVRYGRQGVPVE